MQIDGVFEAALLEQNLFSTKARSQGDLQAADGEGDWEFLEEETPVEAASDAALVASSALAAHLAKNPYKVYCHCSCTYDMHMIKVAL